MGTDRTYKSNREDWGAIRTRRTRQGENRHQASYVGPDGVRRTAPNTFTAKGDARAWLDARRAEIVAGTWESPEDRAARLAAAQAAQDAIPTFMTYATTWVEQRHSSKGQPLRPKTKAEYLRQLNKGLSVFADDRLPAITPARVREWHHKRTKDAGRTMAGAEARLLRAILNTAVVDEIIEKNPVPSPLTRTTTGKAHRPPTSEELAVLVAEIDPRYRLAVLLAAFGGLRLSEWRALRRQDFTLTDEGRYVVHVTRQAQHVQGSGWVVGPTKSAEGVRDWAVPDHLTETITHHLKTYVGAFPDSLAFTPENAPASFLSDGTFRPTWDKAREAAGVKYVVREHDLRHWAGTTLAEQGATLKEIQAFLGHSTAVASMGYLHASQGRLADLTNRMPALPKPKASNVRSITG